MCTTVIETPQLDYVQLDSSYIAFKVLGRKKDSRYQKVFHWLYEREEKKQ